MRAAPRIPWEVALVAAVAALALNFSATRYAVTHGFAPLAYAAPRFLLAAAVFAAVTLRLEGSLRIRRRDVGLLVATALVGITVNQVASVYSLRLATASTVALLFGVGPLLVGAFAHARGVERLSARSWLALTISVAGAALIAAEAPPDLAGELGGALLAVAAVAAWAVYSVNSALLLRRYTIYRANAVVTGVGSLGLVAAASGQLVEQDWGAPTPLAWGAFGYSLVVYVVTSLVWFAAIGRVGAPRASLYTNLEPFLGAVFAYLLLSETVAALQVAGGAVVAAAIVLARRGAPAPP